jgi:hypothetical protein
MHETTFQFSGTRKYTKTTKELQGTIRLTIETSQPRFQENFSIDFATDKQKGDH